MWGWAYVRVSETIHYPIIRFPSSATGAFPRRFSPINLEARYRPSNNFFVDLRTDLILATAACGHLTNLGINRPLKVQAFSELLLHSRGRLVGDLGDSVTRMATNRNANAVPNGVLDLSWYREQDCLVARRSSSIFKEAAGAGEQIH